MIAVLLCAGYATRLYPLTENMPKPLLPVAGRPMIEHILEKLVSLSDIRQVYVVTNHKFAGHFSAWAGEKKYPWPLTIVDDQTTTNENRLGAIGDLAYVLESQKTNRADDIVVLAGDNLFDSALKEFVTRGLKSRPSAGIAVYDVKDRELAKKYGIVRTDETGRVLEFLEKPQDPPGTLASCGVYWLPRETRPLLDRYLSEGHNADQPGHYMRWLAQNHGLVAVPIEGCWYDIGDLNSYRNADELFRASK